MNTSCYCLSDTNSICNAVQHTRTQTRARADVYSRARARAPRNTRPLCGCWRWGGTNKLREVDTSEQLRRLWKPKKKKVSWREWLDERGWKKSDELVALTARRARDIGEPVVSSGWVSALQHHSPVRAGSAFSHSLSDCCHWLTWQEEPQSW